MATNDPPRRATFGRAPPRERATVKPFDYDGEGRALFGIAFKNALLGLVTLGIYRFWGKTRLRRYLWSHLLLFDDRLEYTGTPKELFLGFLIALGILIPLVIGFGIVESLLAGYGQFTQAIVKFIWYLVIGFLVGIAIFRARRYRLTRTLWRGIRFGQTGTGMQYSWRFLASFILGPWGPVILQRYTMRHTLIGNHRFDFDGRGLDMLGRWLLGIILAPFTLGLSLLWYAAYKARYFASQTRFVSLKFELPVTFGDLARIYIPFYLVLLVLFGLVAILAAIFGAFAAFTGNSAGGFQGAALAPIVMIIVFLGFAILVPALQILMITHRVMLLLAQRLEIEGPADPEAILQSVAAAPRTGEGLADALDVGGGLEIGL